MHTEYSKRLAYRSNAGRRRLPVDFGAAFLAGFDKDGVALLQFPLPLFCRGADYSATCRSERVRETPNKDDPWRFPAMALWLLLFVAGIEPNLIFFQLRALADISTYNALLNSHHLITLALAGYLGVFVWGRSREAGLPSASAEARAVQIGALGLLAFLAVPFEQALDFDSPFQRLVIAVAVAKIAAWCYLLSVLLRYYFFSGHRVFVRMATLFPSARKDSRDEPAREALEEDAGAPRRPQALAAPPENAAEREKDAAL